jgi:hypothetical protein
MKCFIMTSCLRILSVMVITVSGSYAQTPPTKSPLHPPQNALSVVSQPNGILLGTHWSSGDTNFGELEPGERTLWIAQTGAEIQVREIPNLLVPRTDGFWHMGTKEVRKGENLERYIWTAPLGQKPTPHETNPHWTESSESVQSEQTVRDLLFVGDKYLAVKLFEADMGGNYGESTTYYVSNFQKPNLDFGKVRLDISAVLGPAGLAAFSKAANAKQDMTFEGTDCAPFWKPTPSDWTISRKKGRWVAQANGVLADRSCAGLFGRMFDLNLKLPRNVVGYDELATGWTTVEKAFTGATDAFESLNHQFLIAVTDKEIIVCRLDSDKVAAVVHREKLRENETVVMAQWALGKSVSRWDEQVRSEGGSGGSPSRSKARQPYRLVSK